ncbi:hypothetical protein WAF17_16645 [Bernardetia sp. ABR2-2B]|uniref:hypothetical protein n=1 Tax=Bernardetia sp. ABR2-2B TaxID=3127472 RepID=UPI0030CF1B6C
MEIQNNQQSESLFAQAFKKMEQGVKSIKKNTPQSINIKGYGFKELESMHKKGLCPRGNYASGRKLSPSAASKFLGNPLEYIRYTQQQPFLGSEATEIGNAFEDVLFYGEKAKDYLHVVRLPKPTQTMATKANKEAFESALAEHSSDRPSILSTDYNKHVDSLKTLLESISKKSFDEEWEMIPYIKKSQKSCITEDGKTLLTNMYKACLQKEFKLTQEIKSYNRQIKVERTCEVTGLKMLGYLDYRSENEKHVIETKTIDDISKAENRVCYSPYAIWNQVAFYSYFAETVTLLFVEKKEPFGVLRMDFSKEELMKLRNKFENEVAIPFAKALEKGFYKTAGQETKTNITRKLRLR